MSFPHSKSQSLTPDAKITLWRLDLSIFNLGKRSFSSHILPDGQPVAFGGEVFAPVPIKWDGFEHNADGSEVSPEITIPRETVVISSLFREFDDCKGCPVERLQTYRRHLDDGDDPDPEALLSYEILVVDRVVRPGDDYVFKIELSDPIAQAGTKIPARTITRDFCPFSYRVWNPEANNGSGAFDLADVFCPYDGSNYFDQQGNPVADPAQDRCGKMLRDCEARHTGGVKIPFGGCPGVGYGRV